MHNKIIYLFALLILCLGQFAAYAQPKDQPASNDKWMRVQSDNGEFLIETPRKYKFYSNEIGFLDSKGVGNYPVTNMKMLNAFHAGSLLSFEIYKADKDILDSMFERDSFRKESAKVSNLKRNGYTIKQLALQNAQSYTIRYYFRSKKYIYVVTAAARSGETPEMRYFLDSIVFKPDTKEAPAPNAFRVSDLEMTEIEVEVKPDPTEIIQNSDNQKPAQGGFPLTIVLKPKTVYVDEARKKGVTGTIRLRIIFAEDGYISTIVVTRSLPNGLLRQALFAAIRIKFLPKVENGVAVSKELSVEYGFDIY